MDDFITDADGGDFYQCDSCTCCSYAGCHGGPDSECPVNSEGDFVCPCTCD